MEHILDDEDDHFLTSISILLIEIRQHVCVSSSSTSSVYHRMRSLTQYVGAMLWPMAQTSKRPDSGGGLCIGQLLIMWSAVCSVHTHMPHCPPVPTSSCMLCTDRPQFAVGLESTVFSAQIFSIDAFSWVRYVAVYSCGSGCFPLLLPRCRNPCILRPVLRDDT